MMPSSPSTDVVVGIAVTGDCTVPRKEYAALEESINESDTSVETNSKLMVNDWTSTRDTLSESQRDTFTEDTLNMISTPWSTESWSLRSDIKLNESLNLSSAIFYSNNTGTSSTLTILPKTSSSYGVSTALNTNTDSTFTLLSVMASPSDSISVRPKINKLRSTSHSSWTVETFTSHDDWSLDSTKVRVNYPWSPSTALSATDKYPSTLASPTVRKVSRETLPTTNTDTARNKEAGHTSPLKYIDFMKTEHLEQDWPHYFRKDSPIRTPNAVAV